MMCEKNSEYGMKVKYVANYTMLYVSFASWENYSRSVSLYLKCDQNNYFSDY